MKALYRIYRPKSLSEVVGQSQVTTPLENVLKTGKISHSYLFTGPRGTGKTSVARIIAHKINEFPYETEDSYLDIIEIDAASNTGVDNIRDLREKALVAPTTGKYKVYIIDEVHMLSKSAFNALLKTLEEPPEHVVFILATTDLEKVPVTITSRSQIYSFRLASPEIIFSHLKSICEKEKIKITDAALKIIVSRGGGSFRDSLSLLDQISALGDKKTEITEEQVVSVLGLPKEKKVRDLISSYESQDFGTISTELKSMYEEGLKPELIAEAIIKSIVASPSPATLPLLSDLPKVSAPFADAKLLLAMLKNVDSTKLASGRGETTNSFLSHKENTEEAQKGTANSNGTVNSSESYKEKSQNSRRIHGSEQSVAGAARTALRTNRLDSEGILPEFSRDSEKLNRSAPNQTSSPFSWPSFLQSINLANPAISKQLETCRFKLSDDSLDIYPTKKITKIILGKPQTYKLLAENLPKNLKIEIHNPEDYKKDPELEKISNIMGGGQQIDTNSSPF